MPRIAWGRCHEEAGAPPYWPWVQILRAVAAERDTDELRADLDAGAGDIADIVPEIRARLPDLDPPATLERPVGDAVPPVRVDRAVSDQRLAPPAAGSRSRRSALGGRALAAPAGIPRAGDGGQPAADDRHLSR